MYAKSLLVGLALTLGTAALPMPSQATEFVPSVSCLELAELRAYLSRAFQETQFAEGTLENGNRVGFFSSLAGTWTLVEFVGDGDGCIYGFGNGLLVERRNHSKRQPF